MTTARPKTLLFDFDGTVSLGLGPVLAYATAVADTLPGESYNAFMASVGAGFVSHPDGQVPGTGAIDGYDLVRILAARNGGDPALLGRAYLDSRLQLGTEKAPIEAPRGLAEFLQEVRSDVTVVVATNAPDVRVDEALAALGLRDLVDVVITDVGKPAGLDIVLDEWLPRGPLLSIGDVWVNDLAPVARRGQSTALVGVAPGTVLADDVRPTFVAEHLHELYPAIGEWVRG